MKNILAENLLRFGVKNFSHEDLYRVSQLLKEQFALPAAPKIDLVKLRAIPDFAAAEDIVKTFMSRSKVLTTVTDAAAMYVFGTARKAQKDAIELFLKNPDRGIQQLVNNKYSFKSSADEIGQSTETLIQFNESPDAKGQVFIQGTMTATSYAASDVPNGAANINDIITYMNNYNILALANGVNTGFDVDPMTKGDSDFKTDVKPGQPGYGAFLPEESFGGFANWLYGLVSFKAASAQTTATTKTEITYIPGPELTSDLGKQLFKTGTITPEPTLAQRVKEATDAAKSLGTILSVTIVSGASFDRPVNADNAQFAQMVGMPANKVPADPRKDQEGIVKDPMSGGNAFLAYYRGIAIKNAMGNQAGVTPTIVAKVETGGDQAQYARIIFYVKKPDDTTIITKDDVASIGTKASSNELGGKFQCIKFNV